MADSSKRSGQETLNLQMLGSSPTSVTNNMVPSNKWPVHRPFKPEMPGSSPAGITVTVVQGLVSQVVDLMIRVRLPSVTIYAVCPGGEGAVLKTVGPKGLACSNRVHGAFG